MITVAQKLDQFENIYGETEALRRDFGYEVAKNDPTDLGPYREYKKRYNAIVEGTRNLFERVVPKLELIDWDIAEKSLKDVSKLYRLLFEVMTMKIVPKIKEITDNIQHAVRNVLINTHIDVSTAEVADLPQNIGGRYHTGLGKIEIDNKILLSKHFYEASAHETNHKINDAGRGKEQIQDEAFCEGLTQLKTIQETNGKSNAYAGYVQQVLSMGHSDKLIKLYKNKENTRLNIIWDKFKKNGKLDYKDFEENPDEEDIKLAA